MNPWADLLSQALNSCLNKEKGFPGETHNLFMALNLPVHIQRFLNNNNEEALSGPLGFIPICFI